MKPISFAKYALLGGLIGFVVHYVKTHAATGISLFSIGPHALEGTLYSLIGGIIGILLFIWTNRR